MRIDERQRKILSLLARESGISAGQLALRLQVSRMTIHRDLRSLLERGLLLRIHGGAVAKSVLAQETISGYCDVCDRPLLPHQRCEIHKADQPVDHACCAACGLRQLIRQAGSIHSVRVGDHISGRMLPADEACFLVNSLAMPCCQPSVLSFANEDEVVLFQAGFGGSIARLDEVLEFMRVAAGLTGDEVDV
ncbi:MAG: DeoR family transcriptional regulator [Geopsychrobacter sp.]|nr:DeoR family transcriptional regulator [Geopsychrobacter sp.]